MAQCEYSVNIYASWMYEWDYESSLVCIYASMNLACVGNESIQEGNLNNTLISCFDTDIATPASKRRW